MPSSYRSIRERGAVRWLLALGLALFLALLVVTVRSAREAWRSSVERGRSEAVFDLVQTATPTRPTRTPGAVAWLDLHVKRYGEGLAEGERGAYRELVSASGGGVPERLEPLLRALREVPLEAADTGDLRLIETAEVAARGLAPRPEPAAAADFRAQRFLELERGGAAYTFALTRRRALDAPIEERPEEGSSLFLRRLAPYLAGVAERLEAAPLATEVAGRPLAVVRVYALAEDGTFVSLPIPTRGAGVAEALRLEGQELGKHPHRPTFVSNEFFFQFDFSRPAARYSGLYLDLAGHGLVTTLTASLADDAGFRAVAAIDLAFDIDWRDFARRIGPPQSARVVELAPPPPPVPWRPWTALSEALEAGPVAGTPAGDHALSRIAGELAEREAGSGYSAVEDSLYHAVVEGRGAVALFQVSRQRWLAVLFPETPARFPYLAAALLLVLGLSLVAGVELNRRRAEAAQRKAEAEMREKESLLDSMRVPLTVVDPNTDAVVYGNAAALALGLEPGLRISELVPAGRAREHYDRMQRLGRETRRAYGVPLELRAGGGREVRHAVVRSVAVAAPIETLHADEHHRLGLFFPLEPEADLAIFSQELEAGVRAEERRRLAGLLAHGVDTLARVLAHRLEHRVEADAFSRWLVGYLERRLAVTAWLLEHWHAAPPLPPETTVEASQVRATLERFGSVFAAVRDDAELRSRLHWDNGVLAGGPAGEPFELRFDWPAGYLFTCPVRGGVGLFWEEALVNAVRHGRPGSRPRVTVELDPVRRELACEVANRIAEPAIRDRRDEDLEPYGGRRLLERLATLFGWHDLVFEASGDRFRLAWRIRVGERPAPDEVD